MSIRIIASCLLLLFIGCFSRRSSDAEETFKYWTGANAPEEITVINGQYFQSPHFSLEYELFLKFKTTDRWWTEFVNTNQLELDRQNADWKMLTELPHWFTPAGNFLMYSKNNPFDRSRYLFDTVTGLCFVYETVGM